MFKVSTWIIIYEKYCYNNHSLLKHKFEKLLMWLQLHTQLIVFDYITTGKNKGWPLSCDSLWGFEWGTSTPVQIAELQTLF